MRNKNIIEESYTINSYSNVPYYTEGPVMDAEGSLYYTNLAGGAIIKRDQKGKDILWAESECPNGQVICANGNHIICDSSASLLRLYDQEGKFLKNIIEGICAGEPFPVPNDVIEDKKGNLYVTNSQRMEGKIGMVNLECGEAIIAKDLDYPNGLALSLNGQMLYVSESYKNRILVIHLTREGWMTGVPEVFALLPENPSGRPCDNLPDGLKVDSCGNIWVAHYGMGMIHKISSEGVLISSLRLPFQLVSNLFLSNTKIIATGGSSEPGPGCILEIEL